MGIALEIRGSAFILLSFDSFAFQTQQTADITASMKLFMISILFLATACGTFSKSTLKQARLVKPGQSQQDVLETLGRPNAVQKTAPDQETWLYDIYSDDSSKTYPYSATIRKGTLVSFEPDTGRGREYEELCQKRNAANKDGLLTRNNGAPDLNGSTCSRINFGIKNVKEVEIERVEPVPSQ